MNSLATSGQYMKNSLGAMIAPLIQAITPAIEFLIDKIVELTNVIGKMFAALTGQTSYTQAVKQAVEYGDSLDSTKKKVKELKDAVVGFDELNIISDKSNDDLPDYGSMFEEVEVPFEFGELAEKIKELIDEEDWREVGTTIGNKLNEIVDAWDAYGWGKRLGEKINDALNLLYGFLTSFDFENLGKKLAEFFNGLFETVDFDLLGRTFAAKWNALFDFIYGFATTLKWELIGLKISEMINGFVDEIKWDRIGQAISEGVIGIFTMLNTAVSNIKWGKLAEGIATTLNNINWYGALSGAFTLITNAIAAGKEFVDAFIAKFKWSDTARQIYAR